ncbi:MAG: galactokinase [Lachnospiraceae bacterium]|nr:galactokinase [Lachnospiraceae bacterium]
MKDKLFAEFKKVFGSTEGAGFFFAPGRVNLIGEHTDYNGGHVFPCALTIGTYGVARKRNDKKLRFYSVNFEQIGVIEADLDSIKYDKKQNWANYSLGVLKTCMDMGYKADCGLELLLFGNIPNSSGLSSSASVEVLTCFIAKTLYGWDIDNILNAKIGQKAENEFIGVNCGIMDQFAIAMGKKDHAIFLDTSDLSYEYAPVVLEGMKLVVACSNKKRGLGDSKYNERRSQCEEALRRVNEHEKVESWGAISGEKFETLRKYINDEVLERRAKHAVYENERTVKAVAALKANDIKLFGELMNASHVSLRDDYEVTGIELDTLVENSWKQEGCVGSRMTGAGFGGCTVSIVKDECIDSFIKNVSEAYLAKIGYKADFYVLSIGDGPAKLD